MKDVLSKVTQYLFYILVGIVLAWTASLTLAIGFKLFPQDAITPFFILALYDLGALIWLLVFIFKAQGLAQRAIAFIAMAIDLIGVVFLSGAELFLGGQELTEIPAGLGTFVVWAVALSTLANVVAIYAYHLSDPDTASAIRMRNLQDRVTNEALNQIEADVTAQAMDLAAMIKPRLRANLMADLRLTGGTTEPQIIDVIAKGADPVVAYAADVASTPIIEHADIGNGNPTIARMSH